MGSCTANIPGWLPADPDSHQGLLPHHLRKAGRAATDSELAGWVLVVVVSLPLLMSLAKPLPFLGVPSEMMGFSPYSQVSLWMKILIVLTRRVL